MNPAQIADRRTLRTTNDVSALCVELLRAVREQEFNARHRGGPAASPDRAWRAWRADLDRYGPLHLVADAQGLHDGGSGAPIGRGRLDDLARRLRERALPSLLFEPGLDAPTYSALVSLLVAEPREGGGEGGAAGFLPEHGIGIRLLGSDEPPKPDEDERDPVPSLDEDKPDELLALEEDGPDGPYAPGLPFDLEPDDGDVPQIDVTGSGVGELERGEATEGTTTVRLQIAPADDTTIRMAPVESPVPIGDVTAELPGALGDDALGDDALGDDALGEGALGDDDVTQTDPSLGPAPESALAALTALDDATPYPTRVARAVAEATDWSDAGDADACHHTIRTLADQSGAKGGLERSDRSVALGGLRELCTGRVLADLIGRATSPDGETNLRASRVLLKLGEPVVPELISAIDLEADPGRRQELLGIAIAMGRATTPTLHRAMEGSSPNRARIAARIAGEIQEERAVPTLSKLLEHKRSEVRGESARALARIGTSAALTTLKQGLASSHDDVSALCAYCLGVTGSPDAAEALTETLRDARRARRTQLASAVIRSLGRLGREESVPELKRVIEKRGFFRRQEIRELKLQAIGALAKLPGQRARDVLEAVAGGSDMGLAVAARRALKELEEGST